MIMRNLRYYLISLAIHAVALGALAGVLAWTTFTPPQFSLRAGGGAGIDGVDDGEAVVLEGECFPCSQTIELRITPPPAVHPAAVRSELTEAQTVESGRLFAPSVETRQIARKVEPPIPEPSPVPPPLPAAKMAPRVAEAVEGPPPIPPEPHRGSARVDVGELLKGSAGTQAAMSSDDGPSDSRHGGLHRGGRAGGGGSDGLPTGLSANVRPPYPPEALARGIEGLVTLRVVVDDDGAVRSAKVETSSGDASLDQSALTTVRDRWHFEPAHRNAVPVECEVLVPIRFRARVGD